MRWSWERTMETSFPTLSTPGPNGPNVQLWRRLQTREAVRLAGPWQQWEPCQTESVSSPGAKFIIVSPHRISWPVVTRDQRTVELVAHKVLLERVGCCGCSELFTSLSINVNCGYYCETGIPQAAWKYWVEKGLVSGGDYNSGQGCQSYTIPPCAQTNGTGRPVCKKEYPPTPKCNHKCDNPGGGISYEMVMLDLVSLWDVGNFPSGQNIWPHELLRQERYGAYPAGNNAVGSSGSSPHIVRGSVFGQIVFFTQIRIFLIFLKSIRYNYESKYYLLSE